jgi:hypothetical protein
MSWTKQDNRTWVRSDGVVIKHGKSKWIFGMPQSYCSGDLQRVMEVYKTAELTDENKTMNFVDLHLPLD